MAEQKCGHCWSVDLPSLAGAMPTSGGTGGTASVVGLVELWIVWFPGLLLRSEQAGCSPISPLGRQCGWRRAVAGVTAATPATPSG